MKSSRRLAPAGWVKSIARDTKLNRDVALKILPDAFASDPDRLARFTREAQVLASLNNPHIAHIYGLDRQDGRDGQDAQDGRDGQDGREGQSRGATSFIVMELVEGQDLAQRLARGAIPLDKALPIAKSRSRKRSRQRTSRGSSTAI